MILAAEQDCVHQKTDLTADVIFGLCWLSDYSESQYKCTANISGALPYI